MAKFYDITFYMVADKSVIKHQIYSEKDPFSAWEDACESITPEALTVQVNDDTFVTLFRNQLVRIDTQEVDGPVEEQVKRHDELAGVINTLSNMGL